MYSEQPSSRQFPKAPIDRRIYAFIIDFTLISIISTLVTNVYVEFLAFCFLWFVLRVVVVDRNRGQSLGRWAMDIKVLDARFNKIPSIASLIKREGSLCLAAFAALLGLKVSFLNLLSMLLLITPILVDGGFALTDEEFKQAFHDRIGQTVVSQTRRGFSLDLRVKKLIQEIQFRLKQNRK